jgi:large subunit ribosomal protein L15
MKAPFSPHPPKDPSKAFESNDDPVILDAMYKKLFGKGGENLLTDEIKWLAVTHKSFDQGRRGFNDRLALLGNIDTVLVDSTEC